MEAPSEVAAEGGSQWKASSSSSAITHLPNCILTEILRRLPIKTVAACRCVCKSWLNLIKTPNFTDLHHATAPTELCLYRYHKEKIVKLYMGNFNFPDNSPSLDVNIHTSFDHPQFCALFSNYFLNMLHFANSCNGLLCFFAHFNQFCMIWNPITSEAVTFPEPEKYSSASILCVYGLGFSRKANRFKLLRLVGEQKVGLSELLISAEMCTIQKICTWETLAPSPYPHDRFRSNVRSLICDVLNFYLQAAFFQGVLHWVVGNYNGGSDVALFSFDFEDDQFGEVPLPPHLKKYACKPGVGVLDGCLVITDVAKYGVNIWLMREYGVQDSWTKVLSLELAIVTRFRYRCCVPLTYLDNGEILMTRTCFSGFTCITVVFSYNPVTKNVTVLGSGPDEHGIIAFKPSLVQLKDSMMGLEVHVKPRSPSVEHKDTTAWWQSMQQEQQGLEEKCQRECAMLKQQIQRTVPLKQLVQQFEDKLRNEQAKAEEQLKEQMRQSEAETARPADYVANDGQDEGASHLMGSH